MIPKSHGGHSSKVSCSYIKLLQIEPCSFCRCAILMKFFFCIVSPHSASFLFNSFSLYSLIYLSLKCQSLVLLIVVDAILTTSLITYMSIKYICELLAKEHFITVLALLVTFIKPLSILIIQSLASSIIIEIKFILRLIMYLAPCNTLLQPSNILIVTESSLMIL